MPGFPIDMISLVRCTHDGSALLLEPGYEPAAGGDRIERGCLRCHCCKSQFHIERGILNLIDHSALDDESRHEQQCRNANGFTVDKLTTPMMKANNDMAMISTLEALPHNTSQVVLELGCGEGRYTLPLVDRSGSILAVDFSIELLRILQSRLPADASVGLVLGDISNLKVAEGAFDASLSTLTSNLPTRAHRDALYALAARALRVHGRFVFCTHHHGIRQFLGRLEKSGRYSEGGIYRYNFNLRECREEPAAHFGKIDARPIQIHLPFARTLRLPVVKLSRMMERVPVLNRFGSLLLCIAQQPRKVGQRITHSKLYAAVVCWITPFQLEIEALCELV